MIPNLSIPSINVFGLFEIHFVAICVILAIITACELSDRRAKQIGLNRKIIVDGILWILIAGVFGAHWVLVASEHPEQIFKNPIILLYFWKGISSYGAFVGVALAAIIYFRIKQVNFLTYLEALLFGFVPAWIIARLACTIAFDHPGLASDFFLAMQDNSGIVRHNLGFYEMLLTIFITIILYRLRNFRPFDGFHIVLIILLYTPSRFFLDTLRITDNAFSGFTVGQYFSILFFSLSLIFIFYQFNFKKQREI